VWGLHPDLRVHFAQMDSNAGNNNNKTLSTLLYYVYSVKSVIELSTTKCFLYVIHYTITYNYTSPDKRPQIHAYIIILEPEMDTVSFTDESKKLRRDWRRTQNLGSNLNKWRWCRWVRLCVLVCRCVYLPPSSINWTIQNTNEMEKKRKITAGNI